MAGKRPTALVSRGLPASAYTASGETRAEGPQLAFDGNRSLGFNSGAFPPGWIEVDLQEQRDIGAITLYAQGNSASAQHCVYISNSPMGEKLGTATLVHRFMGPYIDGQKLHVDLMPIKGRYVQVRTVQSSGWVAWEEVEVYAAPELKR